MKIVSIPHPALRQIARPVTRVDKKLTGFVTELGTTLQTTRNPRGVGLAAPQVDKNWRIFSTLLQNKLRVFLNPHIDRHAAHQTMGEDPDDPIMEGCLSIPRLYGPVPRWEWVDVSFDVIKGNSLVKQSERFHAFDARVMQHELDHLDGVLFTDYSLEYDLPVYQLSETDSQTYKEIDRTILETY